jgi:hypothetical protein
MKLLWTIVASEVISFALALQAQEPSSGATLKALKERTKRGSMSDQREFVRGDTGKWNDTPTLQHAPPLSRKPASLSLDDWAEQLAKTKTATAATDENWLIFRTRQLDDNDRVWIEKIERHGNEFRVAMNEAIWKGRYFKSFTYYEVTAVNFGLLPPGEYTVKWVVQPLTFKQLEKPAARNRDKKDNWPIDEQLVAAKPVELTTSFSVR